MPGRNRLIFRGPGSALRSLSIQPASVGGRGRKLPHPAHLLFQRFYPLPGRLCIVRVPEV